jgi:hypothetical protein
LACSAFCCLVVYWSLEMDSFYGADLLCESLTGLSFNMGLENSSMDSLLSHGNASINSDPLEDACIEVDSVRVESGGPVLDIDGNEFADAVLVEVVGPDSGEMPVVDLTVEVDGEAFLCEEVSPGDEVMQLEIAKELGSRSVVGNSGFAPPDKAFQDSLESGGDNPSKRSDAWAMKRLKEFLLHKEYDTSISFLKLPPFRQQKILCEFMDEVRKKDGTRYPAGSLRNLLDSIAREMRREQERRIANTGVYEVPLKLAEDPIFRKACWACVLGMRKSRQEGIGTKRKQVGYLCFCLIVFGYSLFYLGF